MLKICLVLVALCAAGIQAQGVYRVPGAIFPSTGDLLVGRGHMLSASSECGTDGPERYCIVSHLKDIKKCFYCDAQHTRRAHPVQNVITTFNDRLEAWWQAKSGEQKVSLQLDLEAEFQFTHLIMTFKTFRPAAMVIERSMDFGKTWNTYRYFAYDCERSFPGVPEAPPVEIDDVVCDNSYSAIEPSNGGEVIYRVLEPFITIEDPYAPRIQNLLKITNLRVNFTELHTLGDDLLDSRNDIKNKYYYSLYEMIVRGNCFCYGHADECSPIEGAQSVTTDDSVNNVMVHGRCICQHNTIGLNCEQCKPFHHDLPWKPAEAGQPHDCKPCNCNNHATECHFDPAVYAASGEKSGGVCDNCQHHTTGIHCEQCLPYYYLDPTKDIRDPDVCKSCDCEVAGSLDDGICDTMTNANIGLEAGKCRCKENVEGARCDQCKAGFFGLSESNPKGCTPCDCDSLGTLSGANTCDPHNGQCICKRYTTGRRCDVCVAQTWGMSATPNGCTECDCDVGGSYNNDCDLTTGQCMCRPHIERRRCDLVTPGFFLPDLDFYVFEAEESHYQGGVTQDRRQYIPPVTWTGDGFVMVEEEGVIIFYVRDLPKSMDYNLVLRYQSNMPNMWQYVDISIDRPNQGRIPTSSPCGNTRPEDDHWMTSLPGPPSTHSNLGVICLEKEYTYRVIVDFRRYQRQHNTNGKPDILVDSLIVVPVYTSLEMFQGTVEGRERARQFKELGCEEIEMYLPDREHNDDCQGLLFSMSSIIHDGAQSCNCDPQGSESAICDDWGGQCVCKPNVIGRRCDRCAPGTYGFGPAGCRPCDCDASGSRDDFCDETSGQCTCRTGVSGRRCDQCKPGHFRFPECPRCHCNGHADVCDQDTGVCIHCTGFTVGDHCEMCEEGYYGNPLLGSNDQCKPCMCPNGPGSNRQFADGCRKDDFLNRVVCNCLEGYAGEMCDQCAPAYWGNPHEPNGMCRKCDCNDNVDPLDPNACDARTGVCTGCLYDTAGPHCERCRDFYYGSAFDLSCQMCSCNLLGTQLSTCIGDQCSCDVVTGQCQCLPNVVGRTCDQCAPNHWKLASGEGCSACNCNPLNSRGLSCNEFTGQCQCNDGFGGRTCDDCADGFYGNPNRQCYACECDPIGSTSSQCNSVTGQCPCIDGAGGRQCDQCLRGFTGTVPNCEPCGECFDNWDAIIDELKVRTSAAIAAAKQIGETGITGAYDKEFQEIEAGLAEIQAINDKIAPNDGVTETLNMIQEKLAEQRSRLNDLNKAMDAIQAEDHEVYDDLTELDNEMANIQDQLDALKDERKMIGKDSPLASYKDIEDAAQRSEAAENAARAATTEPGSLVEQSQEIRERVEANIDQARIEFNDKLAQAQDDLVQKSEQVATLTVSQLNEDVCGVATEECDSTCGGGSCGTCGGIGCRGAVEFSKDAKERAQKTQEIISQVTKETEDLRSRVETAMNGAQEAKTISQQARERAADVETQVRKKNSQVRELIQKIRAFLDETGRAKPNEIENYVDTINDLELPVTRPEIDQLSSDIKDLSDRLPEVGDVLATTEDGLQKAQTLLDDSKAAKNQAATVAGDIEKVVSALEKAENYSLKAKDAADAAANDIKMAEDKITSIKTLITQIEGTMDGITGRLDEFDTRLKAVGRVTGDNILSLQAAELNAQESKAMAEAAVNASNESDAAMQRVAEVIESRKKKNERIVALRNGVDDFVDKVNSDYKKIIDFETAYDEYETQLTAKSDRLQELLNEVQQLHESIKNKEEYLRTCS